MTATAKADEIREAARAMGLSMTAKFVPWSLSRYAGEKNPSLNWKVTLSKDGREIITTDYMAGCGHAPSYNAPVAKLGNQNSILRADAIKRECETGKPSAATASGHVTTMTGAPTIEPELADVLSSLANDASAIDCPTFEDWAGDLGYDTDSRKAEAIYRACLEIGLKLRAALGEDGLSQLRELLTDY